MQTVSIYSALPLSTQMFQVARQALQEVRGALATARAHRLASDMTAVRGYDKSISREARVMGEICERNVWKALHAASEARAKAKILRAAGI